MISCEFCEIFKNTFFTEHLRATASEVLGKTIFRESVVNKIVKTLMQSLFFYRENKFHWQLLLIQTQFDYPSLSGPNVTQKQKES